MAFENLDLDNRQWEVYHNTDGMYVPIMDEYPNPRNTFDVFMGVDETKTGKVDAEAVSQAVTTAVSVGSQLYQSRDESKKGLKQRCGSRPILKKNRAEYDRCREEYYKDLQGGGIKSTGSTQDATFTPPPPAPTGMSTTAKVGIALGIIAVGVGAYFLLRKK